MACCDPSFKAALASPFASALLFLAQKPKVTLKDLQRVDAEIEGMSQGAISRQVLDGVVDGLEAEFGFGRIAEDPSKVLRRVIKRGKIIDSDEHQAVLSALSYVGDDGIAVKDRPELEEIFKKYNEW